jgi:hypothetical protein
MYPAFAAVCFLLAALVSCGPSPLPESYHIKFPPLPPLWNEVLGENHWRLDYYDGDGMFRRTETAGPVEVASIEAVLLEEWPSALLAWPYWPEKNLAAELFYPAGAIFPFDCVDSTIVLSWEAGAEAFFYRELDKAQYLNSGTKRKPQFFDWKRFRSFLRGAAPDELRNDPWLADWKTIAEKSVRSGFRQSYVRAEARRGVNLGIPRDGPWIGASPFRPAESWTAGQTVSIPLSSRPELFVCPGGRMVVSENTQAWFPFF